MTLRQFLVHLWNWLRFSPLFDRDPHCYVGVAGRGHYSCLICGREWDEKDDEDEE